jgi:hypothetical protein
VPYMAPYLMIHNLRTYLIKILCVLYYRRDHTDFKGLAEVLNKLIFNNLHNPPPTKYFEKIINPLYSKQLRNLVLVEDCRGI